MSNKEVENRHILVSKEFHKELKMISAMRDKTIKEVVQEAIRNHWNVDIEENAES